MESNTVYTRWNVGLTTRVNDTVLQVRYEAINWRVWDIILRLRRLLLLQLSLSEKLLRVGAW